MSTLVLATYNGQQLSFQDDGWFNATRAAERFGKRVDHWLSNAETKQYIAALCEMTDTRKSGYVRTSKATIANGGGTWLHPKLAVPFARWLDLRFAVWCDEQIDRILRQGRQASAVVVEYLPGYHALHDRVHELAAGSQNERFVHMNVNKLVNKAAGITAGSRGGLPPMERSAVVVAQIVAARAMTAANDHHDGDQNAKQALGALERVLLGDHKEALP